jgi:DNA-binding NtrC family response regulator
MEPILIVDDEVAVRESLKVVFGREYSVHEADGMESALAKVVETSPAVVLLDVLLPKTDGIEVLRRIKAIQPDCRVIMLTALNTRRLAASALESGAFDVVGKPFDVADLRGKVNKALERSASSSGAARRRYDPESAS